MKKEILNKVWVFSILCATGLTSLAQITFEPENGMNPPTSGGFIDNNYYWTEYGVKFEVIDENNNINPARMADIGGSVTAFGNEIPGTTYNGCPSAVNGGGDYPYGTNLNFGCWFITDNDVPSGYPQTLRIDYNNSFQNTTTASGYIFDVDASEGWQIHAYTNNNLLTPEITRQIVGPGWHKQFNYGCNTCNFVESEVMLPTTNVTAFINGMTISTVVSAHNNNPILGKRGDGEAQYWEIKTQNPINRVVIEYLGSKDPNDASVGVAFDGLGGVSSCNITSKFIHAVDAVNSAKINFTDQSSIHNDEKIIDKIWTVDGNPISGNPTSYIFPQSGTYEVCLEVKGVDSKGVCCSDKYCETITVNIPNTPCAMDPDFEFLCFTGNDCFLQFMGDSRNSTRNVKSWFWDFGDGTTSNLPNPIHYYSGSGSYEVCLTIAGDDNSSCCVETHCETIEFSCNGVGLTSVCNNASSMLSAPSSGNYSQSATSVIQGEPTQEREEVVDSEAKIPLKLVPNPAESFTSLHYSLSEDSEVSIELMDLMGNQRRAIISGKEMMKGEHVQKIKLDGLKRGHYIVSLTANDVVENIQLIIEP